MSADRPTRSRRSEYLLWAAAMALIAMMAAAAFAAPRQAARGFLVNDEFYFAHLARNLASGLGFVTYSVEPFVADEIESFPVPEFTRPPGFPLVLSLLLRAGMEDVAAGLALSVFWLGVTVFAFQWLASDLLRSPSSAAILSGLYVASYTTLHHATMAAPEAQICALFALLCVALRGRTVLSAFSAGGLVQACLATKMLAAGWVPLTWLFVVWQGIESSGRDARWVSNNPVAALRLMAPRVLALVLGALVVSGLVGWGTALPAEAQAVTLGHYSLNFLHETEAYPSVGGPWQHLEPPSAFDYYRERPGELVGRTARLMSRTPTVFYELGALPLRGALVPLLALVAVLSLTAGWPGCSREEARFMWFLALCLCAVLVLQYGYLVRTRYSYPLYPFMLLAIAVQMRWLRPAWIAMPHRTRRAMLVAFLAVMVLYPVAWTLREAHRNPTAFLGRSLGAQVLEYDQLAADVRELVPRSGVLIADYAYELSWLVGNPTINRPLAPEELRWVAERFDVPAVVLRPEHTPAAAAVLPEFEEAVRRPGYVVLRRTPRR